MKIIDFISLGAENMVYIISQPGAPVLWQGTRQDFIRELSAFFVLFYRAVVSFDIKEKNVLILYI